MTNFWDTVYPVIEDGDRELRAKPLSWMGSVLDFPLRSGPLVSAGYSWFAYKDSRVVGYEDQAKTDKDRKARAKLIDDGKIPPEAFDKAFAETPKAFYLTAEKDLDSCLAGARGPGEVLQRELRGRCSALRQTQDCAYGSPAHDPHVAQEEAREGAGSSRRGSGRRNSRRDAGDGRRGDRRASFGALARSLCRSPRIVRQAVASIAAGAAFLRKREPLSPAPYLILRGLRWGELRTGSRLGDSTLLEAPPTELRQRVKRLALAKKWSELLDACEDAMALPCSRAWLDLQRLSVAACSALGSEYQPIATAIQSELRALLNDLPELLDATLLDDTPAANPETKAWLQAFAGTPQTPPCYRGERRGFSCDRRPQWNALMAHPGGGRVRSGEGSAGCGTGGKGIRHHACGDRPPAIRASRFRRTMQLIDLVVAAGKDAIAQPLLEDMAAMIENHKLDAWEDPELVAGYLLKLMRNSKKIQGSSGDKQKMFERICRLDPSRH